ncbi:MAG: glycosyltransferase family 2 protein, partial [Desulfurococcaceae archaeon]
MTTVSVVVASYRRSWALPLSLGSLVKQTRRPEEVVVVLKPSGDGSEEVVEGFSKRLNIKLVTQREGNVVDAALLGIRKARGDLLIFLDDDALAEERWVEKYLRLFNALSDAGGIGGIVYKAFKARNSIIKVNEYFYVEKRPVIGPHRRPLEMFKGYCGFIADSGLQ